MPIYSYECEKCSNYFDELLKSFSSKDPTCPKCKSEKVLRVFGIPSISFKGDGWAKDGYNKASTPINASNVEHTVMRFPEYKDRNTGQSLGIGSPEVPLK